MSELTYKMLTLPSVFLMEAQLPEKLVSILNKYLDKLLKNKDRITVAANFNCFPVENNE